MNAYPLCPNQKGEAAGLRVPLAGLAPDCGWPVWVAYGAAFAAAATPGCRPRRAPPHLLPGMRPLVEDGALVGLGVALGRQAEQAVRELVRPRRWPEDRPERSSLEELEAGPRAGAFGPPPPLPAPEPEKEAAAAGEEEEAKAAGEAEAGAGAEAGAKAKAGSGSGSGPGSSKAILVAVAAAADPDAYVNKYRSAWTAFVAAMKVWGAGGWGWRRGAKIGTPFPIRNGWGSWTNGDWLVFAIP